MLAYGHRFPSNIAFLFVLLILLIICVHLCTKFPNQSAFCVVVYCHTFVLPYPFSLVTYLFQLFWIYLFLDTASFLPPPSKIPTNFQDSHQTVLVCKSKIRGNFKKNKKQLHGNPGADCKGPNTHLCLDVAAAGCPCLLSGRQYDMTDMQCFADRYCKLFLSISRRTLEL